MSKIQLYNWQKDCLHMWEKNGFRGIANVITGAGKTVLAVHAMNRLIELYPGIRIRIIVPTIPLVRQWRNAIMQHMDMPGRIPRTGAYYGEIKCPPDMDITIYVINSARDSISRHIIDDISSSHPVLLIADECHHYGSRENSHIFDFIPFINERQDNYFSLGLSATPFTAENRKNLEGGLGEQIYLYSVSSAMNDSVISPFHVFQVSLSFTGFELEEYTNLTEKLNRLYSGLLKEYPFLKKLPSGEFISAVKKLSTDDEEDLASAWLTLSYKRKEVTILSESRLKCAAELINRLHGTERVLIFCERISQARFLADILEKNYPNRIGIYHSKQPGDVKKTTLDSFRDHQTQILISCRALDEGVDVPDASVGLVLCSTSVERQRIQRLGRILRKSSDKELACLYYLYIEESSDDSAYLAGHSGFQISKLKYNCAENEFINEKYELAASHVLNLLYKNKKADADEIVELKKCIMEGVTRPDYFLPAGTLDLFIKNSTARHEKNYWMVMKKIRDSS